jgi:gamma-glutamyltranspeptidase/glutathione hydrolase
MGGRRIMPAVMQVLSFVMDFGMDLDAAIHQPRIDASEGAVVIGDIRLKDEVRDELRTSFDYEDARAQTLPGKFACASVVLRQKDKDGDTNVGAVEPAQPWGDPVAEG